MPMQVRLGTLADMIENNRNPRAVGGQITVPGFFTL